MLREDKRLIEDLHVAVTGCLVFIAYAAVYSLMSRHQPPLRAFPDYLPTIGIIIVGIMAALSVRRLSAIGPMVTPPALLAELAVGFAFGAMGYGYLAYTLKLAHLSRLFVYGGMLSGYALSAAWHLAAYSWHRRGGRSREMKRVLLIGDAESLAGVPETIAQRPALGLEVAGTVLLDDDSLPAINRLLDSAVVDYALFGGYRQNPALIEEAMLCCQKRGVEVWFKMDLMHREIAFSRVDYLEEIPLLVFSQTPRPGAAILVKRGLDLVFSLLLLLALSPGLLLLALLVRLTSPGPVLFRQARIGLNGREFLLYKFRSMHTGEAAEGHDLQNEMRGPVFKMRDDPRVTPLGRLMRKYSLDELPQLWNVLKGEMSLVGPRPPLPSEVDRYKTWHRRRLSMRPGITGLWQVMGRNSIKDFNDWVKLDLSYLDGWSLWLDFKIILKTIPVVLQGTGQ
jgi:exopolysaccharide biosynthesis polyprenyl glycosylphosphotransferase